MCWSERVSIWSFIIVWGGILLLETLLLFRSNDFDIGINDSCSLNEDKQNLRASLHWVCLAILTFSFVQYLEAWIWTSYSKQKTILKSNINMNVINNLATRAIYSALWMQPMSQCIALLLFSEFSLFGHFFAGRKSLSYFNFGQDEEKDATIETSSRLVIPWCSLVGIYCLLQIAKPWRMIYRRWANGLYSIAGCGGHLMWLSSLPHTKDETDLQSQVETQLKKVFNRLGADDREFFGVRRNIIYLITWILPFFFLPHYGLRIVSVLFVFGSIFVSQAFSNINEFSSLWCFFATTFLFIPYYFYFTSF